MTNYIVYDKLNPKFTAKPFLAAKRLLSELYIANHTIATEHSDPGFENYKLNQKEFAGSFASILSEAGKNGETIIALEDSSLASLKYAKSYIANNVSFKEELEKTLNTKELTANFLANAVHVNGFLLTEEVLRNIRKNIKHSFEGFSTAIHIGADLDFDMELHESLNVLFETIKLKRVYLSRGLKPSGYEIYTYAPDIAAKMAGAVLLEAFDSGVDFLIVSDIRTFFMLDTCRKEIEKAVGRTIPLYILTLPQVVLMALGVTDKKVLGFEGHKVKPTILG
jgi:succinate dehydrogenase / fumarate reductase cytochrome b subunit